MDSVEAAKVEVRAWLPRLGALTEDLTAVHVLIESTDERRQQRLYRVRMDLTMEGGVVLVVTHDHPNNGAHEDLYVAIRNGFRAARRQLETHALTGSVSETAPTPPGTDTATDSGTDANGTDANGLFVSTPPPSSDGATAHNPPFPISANTQEPR